MYLIPMDLIVLDLIKSIDNGKLAAGRLTVATIFRRPRKSMDKHAELEPNTSNRGKHTRIIYNTRFHQDGDPSIWFNSGCPTRVKRRQTVG